MLGRLRLRSDGVALAVALAISPAPAGSAYAGRPGDVPAPHAVDVPVLRVVTEDGYEVALQHHETPGGPPVVLCHGISSNHHFWDLEPGRSLALHLQSEGFDVWNMDLRGHGFAVEDAEGRRQRAGWTMDDYGMRDLPAVFDAVLGATGASRLHYVGHSMGGMVLAIYLSRTPDPPIASAVIVSSPLDFRDPDLVTGTLLRGSWLGAGVPFLPTPSWARLLAGLDTRSPLAADEMLYNPDNLAPEARRAMLDRIVSPLSKGEIRQLGRSARDGEFRSADGSVAYREALAEVRVPMLFFAGRADRVANADRVFSYYEAVGSPEKAFVIAARSNGFHGDYGHLDIGVGDHAEQDVFPRIAEWLLGHP